MKKRNEENILNCFLSLKALFAVFFLVNACIGFSQKKTDQSITTYRAKAVDLTIKKENGKVTVSGSSVFQIPNTFVWCGSPIKIKNKYYMFYSGWEAGENVPAMKDSWVLCSKIGVAESDSPYGGYKDLGFFLKGMKDNGNPALWDAQMTHNPLIKEFNGKYYLYYIGGKDPGEQPKGSPGENLSKRDRVQQKLEIGVVEFNSIEELLKGKFKRSKEPLLKPRTRVKSTNVIDPSPAGTIAKPDNIIVVNPAVEYRKSDGKYLLIFKGNIYDPSWRGVHGVAIGNSPTGPFTATDEFIFDIDLGNGNKVSAEDPYIWYHRKDKKFYAVMKDFTGKLTGGTPALAMMESQDGLHWVPSRQSLFMKKELILKDGGIVKVDRLERPQLLLDKNDDPIALYAACSIDNPNNKKDGGTFNIQIPLEVIRNKNE